jgi:hypothetical protein
VISDSGEEQVNLWFSLPERARTQNSQLRMNDETGQLNHDVE